MRAKLSRHHQALHAEPKNNYFLTTAPDLARIASRFRTDSAAHNNCHAVTKHAYNVILIPQGLPVDNQDFTVH
ncbi:MAG TPA: hypothetical protein VGS79_10055 [Puia sp.]|nr:hypothetical protein [Puia sp.]